MKYHTGNEKQEEEKKKKRKEKINKTRNHNLGF
jgi:hypothetical protein